MKKSSPSITQHWKAITCDRGTCRSGDPTIFYSRTSVRRLLYTTTSETPSLKKIISQPSSPVEIKHQTENRFSVPDNSTKTNNSHLKSDVKYPCPSTMAPEHGKHTSLFASISTQKTWVNPSLLASILAVRWTTFRRNICSTFVFQVAVPHATSDYRMDPTQEKL